MSTIRWRHLYDDSRHRPARFTSSTLDAVWVRASVISRNKCRFAEPGSHESDTGGDGA